MNQRIKKLIAELAHHAIDAYLVNRDVNISYLTKFPTSDSWLLVFSKKIFYITDARYTLEVKKDLEPAGIRVIEYKISLIETFFQLVQSMKAKVVGFDAFHLSVALFKQMRQASPHGIRLVARNRLVEELREIKEKEEVDQIRACLKLNFAAYAYLKRVVKPGLSEQDVLDKLERYVKRHKAAFSFPPIIASGPNAAFPHAQVTDRRIGKDESLLVDMGIDIRGYKSDLTRMFFFGRIPPLVRQVNDAVAAAQQAAIKKIRPGVPVCEIDQEARNYLRNSNLAQYFTHSLGHGVGLEIHEAPRISFNNKTILKEGIVFTVEPGVYIPDQFGIRIEDMVLVTANGCEVLSRN